MSWRTVVITKQSKLDFKMNCMIVRQGFDVKKVFIDEIYMVIIESTAVSLTAVLLNALIKAKVKIVFCDEKRNPSSEVMPLYGCHNTSKRCRSQAEWDSDIKGIIWSHIIAEKIHNQARVLEKFEHHEGSMMLDTYRKEIQFNDITQREGHAAKVYFNSLFGSTFTREQENPINAGLDYGYSIFLSAVNREIVKNGYITQLGINHRNQFNQYNLGSDLVEVLRVFVDNKVASSQLQVFGKEEKYSLIELLSLDVEVDGTTFILKDAIGIYCKSVLDALTYRDPDLIRFINYEL